MLRFGAGMKESVHVLVTSGVFQFVGSSSRFLTLGHNLVMPCVCVVYGIHFSRETVFGHERQFRVQQEGLNYQDLTVLKQGGPGRAQQCHWSPAQAFAEHRHDFTRLRH